MKQLFSFFATLLTIVSAQAAEVPKEVISKDVTPSPMTRSVSVIGWVRGDTIPLPGDANPDFVSGMNNKATCLFNLFKWRDGQRVAIGSDADRRYANAFLLKNSANAAPPNVITPGTVITNRDFRLFNRVKAEFQVSGGAISGAPRFIHFDTPDVGDTSDPCTGWIVKAGQNHPANGTKAVSTSGTLFQLNEGRIGEDGQRVDRTVNACDQAECFAVPFGPTTPWIWSTIRFDSEGNLLTPLDHQQFPTYSLFEDGKIKSTFPQGDVEAFISLDEASQRTTEQIP